MSSDGTAPRARATEAQVNLYAHDPAALATFYVGMGMTETFRFPADGWAEHVEVGAAGLKLGLTSVEALQRLAGLDAQPGRPSAEVVLWCDDLDALLDVALHLGARELVAPTVFNGRIRAAWIEDPERNRVKLVALVPAVPDGDLA